MKRIAASASVLALLATSGSTFAQSPFGEPAPQEEPPALPPPSSSPAATQATATPEAEEPSHTFTKKPAAPVGLRFDGGYATRRLFSLGITGADLGFAAGQLTTPSSAFWGTSRVFIGSTENGLSVWSVRIGGEAEYVVDRFRIGAGAGLFFIGVHRAVRDETLISYGVDMRLMARFDAVKSEDFSLFFRGALDAGADIVAGAGFWGPSIGAGVEFDIGKKTP